MRWDEMDEMRWDRGVWERIHYKYNVYIIYIYVSNTYICMSDLSGHVVMHGESWGYNLGYDFWSCLILCSSCKDLGECQQHSSGWIVVIKHECWVDPFTKHRYHAKIHQTNQGQPIKRFCKRTRKRIKTETCVLSRPETLPTGNRQGCTPSTIQQLAKNIVQVFPLSLLCVFT